MESAAPSAGAVERSASHFLDDGPGYRATGDGYPRWLIGDPFVDSRIGSNPDWRNPLGRQCRTGFIFGRIPVDLSILLCVDAPVCQTLWRQ